MAAIDDLFIRIFADGSQLGKGLNEAQDKVNVFSDGMSKLGDTIKGYLSVAAIEEFVRYSMKAGDEADRALAKVAQAIKTTNGVAGKSLEDLKSAADDFKKSTLFDDDQVLNDVSAQLLTFSNIAGENFQRAQVAALDLATVLGDGEGLRGIAIQLGKALNDPVTGLTALRRSGVSFSSEQRNMINAFVETNEVAKAQAIILGEVERQYGGQAVAAAAASNGMKQFSHDLDDVAKAFGGVINHSSILHDVLTTLSADINILLSQDANWLEKFVAVTNPGYSGAMAKAFDQRDKDNLQDQRLSMYSGGESDAGGPQKKEAETYGRLKQELKALQEELELATKSEIEGINRRIDAKKAEIKQWEDVGRSVKNYSGSIKELENQLSALNEKRDTTAGIGNIAAVNEQIKKKEEEIKLLKNASLAWVAYGATVSQTMTSMLPKFTKLSTDMKHTFADAHTMTNKMLKEEMDKMKQWTDFVQSAISTVISGSANLIGNLLGDLITGQSDAFSSALGFIGNIVGQVGQMAIALGSTMLAMLLLTTTPSIPGALALIGLGIAAVGIGKAISNISKSSSSSGSSGYGSSGSGSGTFDTRAAIGGGGQTVQLKLVGRDLVGAITVNKLYYGRQG